MTRQSTKQRGVSLVEVILVLAISSLLVTTVLAGRNSVRSQAQFIDGIERIKETILTVKSDANTGRNTIGKGDSVIPGTTKPYLLLGESMLFDTAKLTTMQTANVLCYANSATDLTCSNSLTSSISSQKNMATPWKIAYTGYTLGTSTTLMTGKLNLVFARDDRSGAFVGSWYPADTISSGDAKSAVLGHQEEITLHFKSTDGREAVIIINPATGGVTRQIL